MRVYAKVGVAWTWLIDPHARTLENYRLEAGKWVLEEVFTGDAPVRVPPFDAIELDMTGWWTPGFGDESPEK